MVYIEKTQLNEFLRGWHCTRCLGDVKLKLGKSFMIDLEHKMGILCDSPELQEDCRLTGDECESFRKHVQIANIQKRREIEIPERMLPAVKGEMENMAEIYWSNVSIDGIATIGAASSIERQLEKLTHP